jgi:hypothetical protein
MITMANKRGNFSPSFNRLSDRDMLLDLLVTEKYMSHLYDHAIMEASGYQVRDTFIALQQEEHETAQMLFDFMHRHGWYTTGANRQKQGPGCKVTSRFPAGGNSRRTCGAAANAPKSRQPLRRGQRQPAARPKLRRQPRPCRGPAGLERCGQPQLR